MERLRVSERPRAVEDAKVVILKIFETKLPWAHAYLVRMHCLHVSHATAYVNFAFDTIQQAATAEHSTTTSRPLVFKSTSFFGRDVKYCTGCGQGTTKDDRATCKACGLSSWISRRIKEEVRTGHTQDTTLQLLCVSVCLCLCSVGIEGLVMPRSFSLSLSPSLSPHFSLICTQI